MSTKNNMLTDISAELDKEFGAPGTPEREKFDEEAYAFLYWSNTVGCTTGSKSNSV